MMRAALTYNTPLLAPVERPSDRRMREPSINKRYNPVRPHYRMDLNEDLIFSRIREINDALELLKGFTLKEFSSLSRAELLAMKYSVIQLVEASASICVHLLENLGERPLGYPDCFIRMGERGLLPKELASRLAAAARLRNLLVHRYWSISDLRVYESVKEGLSDFNEFISHVKALMRG